MELTIEPNLVLYSIADEFADALFKAINDNRSHLASFLPWVGNMQSVENVNAYIANCTDLHKTGKELSFVILHHNILVGRIGLHHIDNSNKTAAIGYWLIQSAESNGIITKACKTLIEYAFEKMHLNRIEIKTATKNIKSQAIPEKLQFKKEGILKQAEFVNEQFLDLVLYALVREDWKRMHNG
jgi:ribosomal-protein-serine acetyltransferase